MSACNKEHGLLCYALTSEIYKKIYYLAQTASQPELKTDCWKTYFEIPIPVNKDYEIATKEPKNFIIT